MLNRKKRNPLNDAKTKTKIISNLRKFNTYHSINGFKKIQICMNVPGNPIRFKKTSSSSLAIKLSLFAVAHKW